MFEPAEFYSGGHKLAANLYLPDPGEFPGRRPAVVVCHGFGGVKEQNVPPVAEALAGRGYVGLTFDYRGFGGSEGPRGRLMPLEQVEDIRNALTFLSARDEVDPDRMGAYGTSFGGANVIYAAGVDERIRAVSAAVPFGDGERKYRSARSYWDWIRFLERIEEDRKKRVLTGESEYVHPDEILLRDPEAREWREKMEAARPSRRFQLPLETAEAVIRYKPQTVVGKISPRALLIVRASNDMLSPPEEAETLFALAGEPKKMVTLQGVSHHGVYGGEVLKVVLKEALAWYDTHLAGEAEPMDVTKRLHLP